MKKLNKSLRYLFFFSSILILIMTLLSCTGELTSPEATNTPYNLTISKVGDGHVRLSWNFKNTTSDSILFHIAKKIGEEAWSEDYFELLEESLSYIDDIYTIDSLVYAYKLNAENLSTGEISSFSNTVAYFSEISFPTNLEIMQTSQNELQISWEDNSIGEDGFIIDKKIGEGSWDKKYRNLSPNTSGFIDQTELFTTVSYRAYAFTGDSDTETIENSILPTLPAPDSLILTKPDPNKIKLTWLDKSSGEQGFFIDRKIGGMDWETEYADVDSNFTTWIDDINLPCGTFSYRVRAFSTNFYSGFSNEESINIRLDIISSTATPGEATDVYFYNWYAFIADKYSGLSVVNCVDPSNPAIITYNQGGLPDRTSSVFVRDEICYVTSHSATNDPGMFYMINVSEFINDPTQPFPSELEILGSCETNGIPKDIFAFGDYAFIADGDAGLSTIICSGPPHSISNLSTNGDARNIYIHDSYAFIANGLNGGLTILDVANPFNPSHVSNLPLEGLAQGIFVNGDYAYLANYENGLEIINVSDVYSPSLISNLDIQGFASSVFDNSVFADDNYIYMTDKDNGFLVIDISDHSAPYILGTVSMTTQPVSVYLFGSYAFVADNEGLKIIQVLP